MIILVDMDQVLADWSKKYDEILESYGERAAHIKRARGTNEFNLFIDASDEDLELIQSVFDHENLYKDLDVIPGSKEALNEMIELGHQVFIVSTPTVSSDYCASDKFIWLKKNFGIEWAERLILTVDKTVVTGDFLIDDKPEVKGINKSPDWVHVVFDQTWNRHVPSKPRLFDWSQWQEVILSALPMKVYRDLLPNATPIRKAS